MTKKKIFFWFILNKPGFKDYHTKAKTKPTLILFNAIFSKLMSWYSYSTYYYIIVNMFGVGKYLSTLLLFTWHRTEHSDQFQTSYLNSYTRQRTLGTQNQNLTHQAPSPSEADLRQWPKQAAVPVFWLVTQINCKLQSCSHRFPKFYLWPRFRHEELIWRSYPASSLKTETAALLPPCHLLPLFCPVYMERNI